MQFPYTIPISTHKLFQCNMHVFLFNFLNVNMNKRKYAHIINQSFIRMTTFTTVLIRRKRRIYDTSFWMKINQLYPNFHYWSIMTKKTWRNINQSKQSWARPGDKSSFSETWHSLIKQKTIKQRKFGQKNSFQRWEIDPRRISTTQSGR